MPLTQRRFRGNAVDPRHRPPPVGWFRLARRLPTDSPNVSTTATPKRCFWVDGSDLYDAYHDREWGRPVSDDVRLFEKISLEGFQAGLSWITILKKRENFRAGFDGFDFHKVALYGDKQVASLLQDAGSTPGGIWTPASAMGQRLIDRLDDHVAVDAENA